MRAPRRRLVLTAVAVTAALAVLMAVSPVARSTARSPRALLLIVVTVVAISLGTRLVARRWGGRAAGAVRLVALSAVAWLFVIPAFRQTTADEALPMAAADVAADAPATSSPPPAVRSAPVVPAGPAATGPAGPAAPAAPVLLTTGRLAGIGHEASGTVSVYRLPDGSAIVRFRDVDIEGAPDPVLYLVPGANAKTRDGGVEVGPLEATKGSFNQPVPPSFDLDQPFTVFVWCERFATPIAHANQRA